MSKEEKKRKNDKTAIEIDAQINEIIKRDNKFYSINKDFHLNLKTCILYTYFI